MELSDFALESHDMIQPPQRGLTYGLIEWVPLVALPTIAAMFRSQLPPWQFMWVLSIAIFLGCKWQTWISAGSVRVRSPLARNLGYLLLWPGMDARTFLDRDKVSPRPRATEWLIAATKTLLGCSLVWLAARNAVSMHTLAIGWMGMIGIVLILHFGLFHLLALAWQSIGVAAQPIMQAPLWAASLSEFWGKRWNLGFRQLTYGLVFRPVRKRFGTAAATLAAFLVSGVIHDLVISLPAGGGYGLPTCYFVLQGIGVLVERSKLGARLGLGCGPRGWLFVLFCAGGPVFWLFHPPFVRNVMLPFLAWIGRL